ncbi:MAG: hypothetical protein DIU52_009620 [bacterium]
MDQTRRRLLSTRRVVPADRLDEYATAWERVQRVAREQGARAWLFRLSERHDHFIEFIEYGDAPGALDTDELRRARASLEEQFGPGATEEWEGVA